MSMFDHVCRFNHDSYLNSKLRFRFSMPKRHIDPQIKAAALRCDEHGLLDRDIFFEVKFDLYSL